MKKVIAIIPARSGSKGLKDKNILPLAGKPLMAYTITAAKESGIFDEIIVSTDSPHYAEIAKEYGAQVPFLRDISLASDTASSWDVVRSTLESYESRGYNFDTLALLQPTSPLRSAEDIKKAFDLYQEKNANAIVSLSEVDHSPLWSNTLPEDHSLVNFIRHDIKGMPRQQLEKYYRINGALYIVNISYFRTVSDIYQERCYGYVMPKNRSIDIDDEIDFLLAEVILNKFCENFHLFK